MVLFLSFKGMSCCRGFVFSFKGDELYEGKRCGAKAQKKWKETEDYV